MLPDDEFRDLMRLAPIVGATCAHPGMTLPVAFESAGIRPRHPSTNTPLGITTSWPKSGEVVAFGLSYIDNKDAGTHDEDMFELNLTTRAITPYHDPRDWLARYPEYGPYHHGDKSFLMPPYGS